MSAPKTPGFAVASRKRVLVVLCALIAGMMAMSTVGVTSATWSDSAYVTVKVDAANWVVGDTCEVRKAGTDALVPGRTCSVTFDRVQSWTTRDGNARWEATAPGILNDEYIAFVVTMPTASLYAGWDWPHVSSVLSQGTLSSNCASVPQFKGKLNTNLGQTPQIYLTFSPSSTTCS